MKHNDIQKLNIKIQKLNQMTSKNYKKKKFIIMFSLMGAPTLSLIITLD